MYIRAIKQILMAVIFVAILIFGWRYPLLGYFIPLCMVFGLAIGFFKGRKWCDWYCPRGSFYDTIGKTISRKGQIPTVFKNMRFRIIVLILLMGIMTINLVFRWPNFYNMGRFFVVLITVTTVLGVILAIIFHQRSWCSFCPIGTIINLIGSSKLPLKINSELCIDCKACYKVCPVQIKPYKFKKEGIQIIKDGDCLKCDQCILVCPKKALFRNQ